MNRERKGLWLSVITGILTEGPTAGGMLGMAVGLLIELATNTPEVVFFWQGVQLPIPIYVIWGAAGMIIHFAVLTFLVIRGTLT